MTFPLMQQGSRKTIMQERVTQKHPVVSPNSTYTDLPDLTSEFSQITLCT